MLRPILSLGPCVPWAFDPTNITLVIRAANLVTPTSDKSLLNNKMSNKATNKTLTFLYSVQVMFKVTPPMVKERNTHDRETTISTKTKLLPFLSMSVYPTDSALATLAVTVRFNKT